LNGEWSIVKYSQLAIQNAKTKFKIDLIKILW
jgi:hypothetical protein